MPLLRALPRRFLGVADNSDINPDFPSVYTLAPGQCIDAKAWDFRHGRAAKRPSTYGSLSGATFGGGARGLIQAKGDSYDKILVWNHSGRIAHYSGGAFVDLGASVAGATSPVLFQGANGLNKTILPFGGSSALTQVVGGTPSSVGGTAPSGLICVAFFRLSSRFLGFRAQEDTLRYCAANDVTKWNSSEGGGSEPIGNERHPLTTIGEGPGDMTTLFKSDYVYVIERTSPRNWNIRKRSGDRGAVGTRAWCLGPDGALFFAHDSGIWLISGDGGVAAQALTTPIEEQWGSIFDNYPAAVQYINLAYEPKKRILWALVPNDNTNFARRLWRCYVPDGSWCVEDEITSGTTQWTGLIQGRDANGKWAVFRAQEDLTAQVMTVETLDSQGAYNGAFVRPRPEGDPSLLKQFGVMPESPGLGQNMFLYLRTRGSYNAQVTVTVWEDDGTQTTFGPHNVSLAGATLGRPLLVEVPVPPSEGKFIDIKVANGALDQVVDLVGYDMPYDAQMIGTRRV